MITKINSIKVSERVFNILDDFLEWQNGNGAKLSASLQTFYNGREQGYWMTIDDWQNPDGVKEALYIYVCEARSSDNILVIIQTDYTGGMFSEKAYKQDDYLYFKIDAFNNSKRFSYNQEHDAAEYIYKKIKEFFKL